MLINCGELVAFGMDGSVFASVERCFILASWMSLGRNNHHPETKTLKKDIDIETKKGTDKTFLKRFNSSLVPNIISKIDGRLVK